MNTFETFEKETNEQFIYITQLLRGTLQGIKVIIYILYYTLYQNFEKSIP